jgi:hypothetical protein
MRLGRAAGKNHTPAKRAPTQRLRARGLHRCRRLASTSMGAVRVPEIVSSAKAPSLQTPRAPAASLPDNRGRCSRSCRLRALPNGFPRRDKAVDIGFAGLRTETDSNHLPAALASQPIAVSTWLAFKRSRRARTAGRNRNSGKIEGNQLARCRNARHPVAANRRKARRRLSDNLTALFPQSRHQVLHAACSLCSSQSMPASSAAARPRPQAGSQCRADNPFPVHQSVCNSPRSFVSKAPNPGGPPSLCADRMMMSASGKGNFPAPCEQSATSSPSPSRMIAKLFERLDYTGFIVDLLDGVAPALRYRSQLRDAICTSTAMRASSPTAASTASCSTAVATASKPLQGQCDGFAGPAGETGFRRPNPRLYRCVCGHPLAQRAPPVPRHAGLTGWPNAPAHPPSRLARPAARACRGMIQIDDGPASYAEADIR